MNYYSEARIRAHQKYIDKNDLVEVKIRVSRTDRESMKEHAESMGESLNGFISRAIKSQMYADKKSTSN